MTRNSPLRYQINLRGQKGTYRKRQGPRVEGKSGVQTNWDSGNEKRDPLFRLWKPKSRSEVVRGPQREELDVGCK